MVLVVKQTECQCISPHLIDGYSGIVNPSSKPIFFSKPMVQGSKPADGGNLILDEEAFQTFKENEPKAVPYIKRLVGGIEMLYGKKRWCLWLPDAPKEVLELPMVAERIEQCRKMRMSAVKSGDAAKLASTPHLFRDIVNPDSAIILPRLVTEHVLRMPAVFIDSDSIAGNQSYLVLNGDLTDFAVLSSRMHCVWVKWICGRHEFRFRYSVSQCYNAFPLPQMTSGDRKTLANIAKDIVSLRKNLKMPLIDLCRSESIPEKLQMLYLKLDNAFDQMYDRNGFKTESGRLKCLLRMYEEKISRKNVDIDQWC